MESAIGMLLWLGSSAMHTYAEVVWPSGIWHPSTVTVSVVEHDMVPIDSITNGMIGIARNLGLDPIQDTVKEGPSGLIARLEQSRPRCRAKRESLADFDTSLEAIANLDTTDFEPARLTNVGNVRALIYPSGRSFMSYLYDSSFFNTIDDLVQHGCLSVRGKVDQHRLSEVNIAMFLPFYQGALANMVSSTAVQGNFAILLRQMLVLWPMGDPMLMRRGDVGAALRRVEAKAAYGIESIEAMSPPPLTAREYDHAIEPMFDLGVGIRYSSINRPERLTRIAVAVAFWRIADGGNEFDLLDSDYAVADAIMHGHEMGSRLVELCCTKGKSGYEALRFVTSLHTESSAAKLSLVEGAAQTSDAKQAQVVLEFLYNYSILVSGGGLHDSYTTVAGDVIKAHRLRWDY